MINLTVSGICIYLCIAMSSLTLTASILALYILISLTNNKNETGQTGQTGQQEVRQREESSRPLCLATQLWICSINITYKFHCCDIGGITWERPERPRDAAGASLNIFPRLRCFPLLRKLPPADSGHFEFPQRKASDRGITLRPGFAAQITVNNTRVRGILGFSLRNILS